MLKGIDTSNWQGAYDVAATGADFVFAKATEGTWFVDGYCDDVMRQCQANGTRAGFYHFGGWGSALDEAEHFVTNTRNYFSWAIPVLDWESGQSAQWAQDFCNRVQELTGVFPMVYSWARNLAWVPIDKRWCANILDGLQAPSIAFDPGNPPIDCAIWQYASDGKINGISGNVDMDVCYIDIWDKEDDMSAQDVWNYNYENTAREGNVYNTLGAIYDELHRCDDILGDNSYGNLYTRICYIGERVQRMDTTIQAQAAAIEALAKSVGADPQAIAKAVSDAVTAQLEKISLNVEINE